MAGVEPSTVGGGARNGQGLFPLGRAQTKVDITTAGGILPSEMPSLRQLLAEHGDLLVLDASSTVVQAGVLRSGGGASWRSAKTDSNEAIFACAHGALREAGTTVDRIAAFVYCGGPGSMLGARTIAMALRTWLVLRHRPCFRYLSLAVAGRAEWLRHPRAFAVTADARREGWHWLELAADGSAGELRRVATADFPAGEVVTPAGFRRWAEPPRPLAEIAYDIGAAFAALPDDDFFAATPEPEALAHAAPDYVKWSPQIHRAPAAPA